MLLPAYAPLLLMIQESGIEKVLGLAQNISESVDTFLLTMTDRFINNLVQISPN